MRAELRRWLADRFTWWAYVLDAPRFHEQAHGLAEIDRVTEGRAYTVSLRTRHQYTGEREVIATDASEALKSVVGTGPWPSPSVVVLTLGDPDPDHVERELSSVISTERAIGWRERERRRPTDTGAQGGSIRREFGQER